MTTHADKRSPRPRRSLVAAAVGFVVALALGVLISLLNAVPASAASAPTAENAVGASTVTLAPLVGLSGDVSPATHLESYDSQAKTVSATGVAADSGVADGVGATTLHGAERIAGTGATRGGVLAADQIVEVRVAGQVLTQADGATVSILENTAGRFDVVVDGSRGLITTFSNLSLSSLARLAAKYGWE
jgi:hypothetical protein